MFGFDGDIQEESWIALMGGFHNLNPITQARLIREGKYTADGRKVSDVTKPSSFLQEIGLLSVSSNNT